MDAPDTPLRLGTRASPLAMAQANMVRDALLLAHGWNQAAVEIVAMVATGDRIQDRALAEVGGKALWTKELDAALGEGRIDFAVHSMKDVETERPEAFVIAAMLPRADVRDCLIGAETIEALPNGARFGTSAPRRRAQLLRTRPDLRVELLRGNVQTRLAKVERGEVDASLLAKAGLDRLGLAVGHCIGIDTLLPAPSQGAIGIETLGTNEAMVELLGTIDHADTHGCVLAERALLAGLNGDCRSPIAAHARIEGDEMTIRAQVYSPDGAHMVERVSVIGETRDAVELGREMIGSAPPAIRAVFAA